MIKEAIASVIGLASILAVTTVANGEDENTPALWVAEDADTRVYLFGTYHMVPNDIEWRTSAFEEAMAEATITYLEVDGFTPEGQAQTRQIMLEQGLNPEGATLSEQLGPERAAAFSELAARFGLPMAQLERLRPWLAVVSVTQGIYAQMGLQATSIDAQIYQQSGEEGDEVRFLESQATQLGALSNLGGEEMLRHVDLGIENIADLEGYTDDLLTAWTSGDTVALEALVIAQMEADTPGLFQSIFVERNENWADQISAMLDADGHYIVAVGAGHLVGEQSVIAMLRREGVSVERLQ